MSLTITEWAKANPTPLTTGIVETFARFNPVLAVMPFTNIAGSAYQYNREGTLPNVAWRGFNGSYTESTGTLDNKTVNLKIIGGDSDYDVALIRMGSGDESTRAAHDALKAKALSLDWLNSFFNNAPASGGDVNGFTGLVPTLAGGSQEKAAATNGAALALSMLDELLDNVEYNEADTEGSTYLYMRPGTLRAYRALLRATGGIEPTMIMDKNFGRPLISHNGAPILTVGKNAAGNDILPGNETQGTNSNTASIFAIRYGSDGVQGVQTEPMRVEDLGEVDSKPAYRTRIEWYSSWVSKHPRAAARLKGITNV